MWYIRCRTRQSSRQSLGCFSPPTPGMHLGAMTYTVCSDRQANIDLFADNLSWLAATTAAASHVLMVLLASVQRESARFSLFALQTKRRNSRKCLSLVADQSMHPPPPQRGSPARRRSVANKTSRTYAVTSSCDAKV